MKTKVKLPPEDPAIKAARDAEQRRADSAFQANAGEVLDEETRKRIRRFGARVGPLAAIVAGGGSGSSSGGGGNPGGSTSGSGSTGAGRLGPKPADKGIMTL